MITQIYAATSFDEATCLVKVGVDFIGVVVGITGDYPGILTITQAKKVLSGVTGNSKKVVLPFTEKVIDMRNIAIATHPDILHIAVEPSIFLPIDIAILRKQIAHMKIMRTIPVENEKSIDLARMYDGRADYLLLDSRSKDSNKLGVTGETHDWNISRKIVQSVLIPVILAGGLGPDNVADAIATVKPFGVDSKTKTDIAGNNQKDLNKVKRFVEIAKSIN